MDYLYKLAINLKECLIVFLDRIFPEFDLEWPWALHYPLRKSNIQISKGFLQANFPSITKTHKL